MIILFQLISLLEWYLHINDWKKSHEIWPARSIYAKFITGNYTVSLHLFVKIGLMRVSEIAFVYLYIFYLFLWRLPIASGFLSIQICALESLVIQWWNERRLCFVFFYVNNTVRYLYPDWLRIESSSHYERTVPVLFPCAVFFLSFVWNARRDSITR